MARSALGVDVAVGASQKGLICPPGVGFVVVNAAAFAVAERDPSPRLVARGGRYLSARVAPHVQDQLRGVDERPAHQRLTVREHQIKLVLLKGIAPADIGEEMMISIKTVSAHRTHILDKLGVSSTAELVLYAVRQGIIH